MNDVLCYNYSMSISQSQIEKIIDMRKHGYSIPEISTAIAVAKSTVTRHAKQVAILPEYYSRWQNRKNTSKILSETNWSLAQNMAENSLISLDQKDLLLIGASLYWAEGSKKDFSFCNTDPQMISVFMAVLRRIFRIKDEDLRISIRVYEDLDQAKCIKFWSNVTGIDLQNNVSINILKGKKLGKLQYGMCRIRVKKGGQFLKNFVAVNNRVNYLVRQS